MLGQDLDFSGFVIISLRKLSTNVYNLHPTIPICEVFVDLFLLLFLMFPPCDILMPCVLDFIFDYRFFTVPHNLWGFSLEPPLDQFLAWGFLTPLWNVNSFCKSAQNLACGHNFSRSIFFPFSMCSFKATFLAASFWLIFPKKSSLLWWWHNVNRVSYCKICTWFGPGP